jgi:hypothetical protein
VVDGDMMSNVFELCMRPWGSWGRSIGAFDPDLESMNEKVHKHFQTYFLGTRVLEKKHSSHTSLLNSTDSIHTLHTPHRLFKIPIAMHFEVQEIEIHTSNVFQCISERFRSNPEDETDHKKLHCAHDPFNCKAYRTCHKDTKKIIPCCQ